MSNTYLAHFGIKGQKWGIRRFQNTDGSLTPEGRIRYGKAYGVDHFVKDALKDLKSKVGSDNYEEAVKRWSKTADESGQFDPSYKPQMSVNGNTQKERDILSDIHDNMPSTIDYKAKQDKRDKELLKQYTEKDSQEFRAEKIKHLQDTIARFSPHLQEELNMKSLKDTRNYVLDAMKGYNEGDVDFVVDQRMNPDVYDLWDRGKLSDKIFNNYYDGEAADYAVDMLGYGWGSDRISEMKEWNYIYKQLHKNDTAEHSDDDPNTLYHHGIKGQKWGIRRFQNEDGTITEEGRRHYGYGKYQDSEKTTEHTKERMRQGAKIGALAGAVTGAGVTALTVATLAPGAAVLAPGAAVILGATEIMSYSASGALRGTLYGGLLGAAEVRQGRKYIAEQDALQDVKMSELNKK